MDELERTSSQVLALEMELSKLRAELDAWNRRHRIGRLGQIPHVGEPGAIQPRGRCRSSASLFRCVGAVPGEFAQYRLRAEAGASASAYPCTAVSRLTTKSRDGPSWRLAGFVYATGGPALFPVRDAAFARRRRYSSR